MSYRNPTLKEIYSELFFESPIDIKNQYTLVDLFRDEYSNIELSPDIMNAPSNASSQTNLTFPLRFRLWRSEKKELFQVFSNRIAYNNIISKNESKYNGWTDYLTKYVDNMSKVDFAKHKINRISLCYIDEVINLVDEDFQLKKYLNCSGDIFPQCLKNNNQSTNMIIGYGKIGHESNVQLKLNLINLGGSKYNIKLETVLNEQLDGYDIETIKSCLNRMHKNSVDLFERMITDKTRNDIMGGVYDGDCD